MDKPPCCICNVYLCLVVGLWFVTTKLVSEASPRTLVVLDVDGWQHQINVKDTPRLYNIIQLV